MSEKKGNFLMFYKERASGYIVTRNKASQVELVMVVKNLPANAGHSRDKGLIPGLGRSPGVGNDTPFQYSCLENSMKPGGLQSMGWQRARQDLATRQQQTHEKMFYLLALKKCKPKL